MVKSKIYDPDFLWSLAESFKEIPKKGEAVNQIDTTLKLPEWNEETRKFYEEFCNRKDVLWGIFIPDAVTPAGMNDSIGEMEEKLDYKFGLCMQYSHLPHDLPPAKGLQEAWEDGKITELSLQTATFWNNDLEESVNPNFQIIDGVLDEEIRAYARTIKEFGHPVLLRVNNEMNGSWTSYCGIQLMCDPELFRMVYDRIYDIFEQEGADNVIWVFNPQYGNYPPVNFNHFMAYFPGADKVQMLGLTVYNSGEYYQREWEIWQSFDELYGAVNNVYQQDFADWPWIIGEFGTDSHGGNKENWITNMFNSIGKYPNIKGAVWLNWEAYDTRKGSFGVAARCYRLDETEGTLNAFRAGLHGEQPKEILPEKE